ncbi:aminodeoxychorismate lyase apoprotein [Dyella jiangningensis]|uniref:aminodeoxychorismate lyase n=1 Tax=Dyella sp. AtDHG13 TaxID=1938897 RepID=UPI00088BC8E9|nr:aminodeoxychorismate lyase [Dyella sp. AtDHG13]PXV60793.1 aminodeoxychorismate lyase apoprotein [Dyella sp. AtDHG13]SDK97807.1 aminodeoxychorismate lyase apoprotein [Dyella jiangningensis]
MVGRVLVNGEAAATVSVFDRGLSYGDGLFETIRFVHGVAPLWSRHMDRLREGCRRLGLPQPDAAALQREAVAMAAGMEHAVVRITLTRGLGERGYAPPASPTVTRIVAGFDAPAMSGDAYVSGIRTRWCETTLALQPRLAGLKHLNRLEQVLARAEWSDPAVAEGLMRDVDGRVMGGTMTNLFAVLDGQLVTPALDRCGVAGVARAEVLAAMPAARIVDLSPEDLARAEEVFLSSSVRGILAVQAVDDTVYVPGPVTRALQQHWRALGFPMEHA